MIVSWVYMQQLCRPSTTCYNSLLSPVCGLWLFVLLLVLQPAAERTTVVTFNKLKWTSVLNTMKNVHFVFPLHEEVIFLFRPTCEPISIWLVHSIIPVALCAVSFWDTSTSEWACISKILHSVEPNTSANWDKLRTTNPVRVSKRCTAGLFRSLTYKWFTSVYWFFLTGRLSRRKKGWGTHLTI